MGATTFNYRNSNELIIFNFYPEVIIREESFFCSSGSLDQLRVSQEELWERQGDGGGTREKMKVKRN